MRGKLMLGAGLAVGFVLGSRAGRERYEQIAKAAGNFWNSRSVQNQLHHVEDFAKDKAPEVVGFVSDNVGRAMKKSAAKKKAERARNRAAANNTTPTPSN